jgi:hypothetical protein
LRLSFKKKLLFLQFALKRSLSLRMDAEDYDDSDVDDNEIHQQVSLRSLLQREDDKIQAYVLTFPREYCGSVATGCFTVNDLDYSTNNDNTASRTVFCKDRGRAESLVQEAGAHLGDIFARCFSFDINTGVSDGDVDMASRRVVAACETIDRPRLEDMKPGSAGAQMWRLKETQWQRMYEKKAGNEEESGDKDQNNENDSGDEDSSSSSVNTGSSASNSAPSTKECWLLEEAVRYYDPTMSTSEEGEANATDALFSPSLDSSLRRKLRMAADRTVSGCLDMVSLFMLTEASQKYVNGRNPEWPDYKVTHQLGEEETRRNLALTADETRLLFYDKLIGPEVQVAMLYTIVVGLPDNHCGNMAIQEVVVCRDESSIIGAHSSRGAETTWRLRIVHFDTGLASVHGGVSLRSFKLAYDEDKDSVDYGNDFDFEGGDGTAYYYPILFSSVFSEASECPLDVRVRERMLCMDGREFDRLITKYDELQQDSNKFGQRIIGIFQQRLEKMKRHAEKHPQCTCKDLAFSTISALKRDYAINEEHEVFVEWIKEVKSWAQHA